jgi:hypothetical protein
MKVPVENDASSDSSHKMRARLDGVAAAFHRQLRPQAIDAARLAAAGVDLGVDDPGANAVDADPFGGD